MPHRPETILAIDPGLKELGYAVLRNGQLAASGVVDLREVPKPMRLAAARRQLSVWMRTHEPSDVVVEKTYPHLLPWLDRVHGIARSARNLATRHGAAFAMYAPQRVRATVVGNGKAKKAEVALAVAHRFRSLRVYLTQDRKWKVKFWQNQSDAVALALHHRFVIHPPSRSRSSG
jgi:Holliday junction resolvasome RuvABC endonuclease subunit